MASFTFLVKYGLRARPGVGLSLILGEGEATAAAERGGRPRPLFGVATNSEVPDLGEVTLGTRGDLTILGVLDFFALALIFLG